jgi:hypothetical protein
VRTDRDQDAVHSEREARRVTSRDPCGAHELSRATSRDPHACSKRALCYADRVLRSNEQAELYGVLVRRPRRRKLAVGRRVRALAFFAAATIAACAPSEKSTNAPATKSSGAAPLERAAPKPAAKQVDQDSAGSAVNHADAPSPKPPPATLLASIALLASAAPASDYNRTIGVEPSYLPPGNVASGGEGGPSPRQYLAMVDGEETRRMRMALAGAKTEVRASCFLVAFEVNAPSSAVVLTVAKDGSIERRFPLPSKPDAPNRFEPGTTHVLPRRVVAITPDSERIDAVDFDPGFRVSGGSSPESGDVTVIFALASAPLERDLVGKLDALVAEIASTTPAAESSAATSTAAGAASSGASAKSAGRLEVWLAENGFAVRELRVRAP